MFTQSKEKMKIKNVLTKKQPFTILHATFTILLPCIMKEIYFSFKNYHFWLLLKGFVKKVKTFDSKRVNKWIKINPL